MKYKLHVILSLVLLFFAAQLVGLAVLNYDMKVVVTPATGVREVIHSETVLGPRPEAKDMSAFFLIMVSLLIGTALILVIMKLGKVFMWKGLYIFAVFGTLSVAFGVFLEPFLAYGLAIALALLKIFRQSSIVNNVSEVLIYTGIALIFAPLFSVLWITLLLLAISGYDMYAVWKSKHMIKLAEFQMKSKLFAGLSLPYAGGNKKLSSSPQIGGRPVAILGGGDVAFPLMFSTVVMEFLVASQHISKLTAFAKVLIIPIVVSAVLFYVLYKGKKGHYYPAMPFITAGCLAGLGIVMLI
ncbi:MAG: presenilin family intramembrane aspartyl protease [Candidatus Aenigmatarchaeota archaeon]